MIKKQMYEAPEIEVLELRMAGVIAASETGTGSGENLDDWDE